MPKRSSFVDMLGAPKTDLRKKYNCPICKVAITSKNQAMSSTAYTGDRWTEEVVYCKDCFLKPEALSGKGV